MVLRALAKFEEHLLPAGSDREAETEARRILYGREQLADPKLIDIPFEQSEARKRSRALRKAIKAILGRQNKGSAQGICTNSFPGQEFVSPSRNTRFGSWVELLLAGARAEDEAATSSGRGTGREPSPGNYLSDICFYSSRSLELEDELNVKSNIRFADYHISAVGSGPPVNGDLGDYVLGVTREILSHQFFGDPTGFVKPHFRECFYSAPGMRETFSGEALLSLYKDAFLSSNSTLDLAAVDLARRFANLEDEAEERERIGFLGGDGSEVSATSDSEPEAANPTVEISAIDSGVAATLRAAPAKIEVIRLGMLARYEQYSPPQNHTEAAFHEKLKAEFIKEGAALPIVSFEEYLANHRAEALYRAIRYVFRRYGDYSLPDLATYSFPGYQFISPSGRTCLNSWTELLKAGCLAEFEGTRWKAPDPDRPMTPGEYLRHMIRLIWAGSDQVVIERDRMDKADYHLLSLKEPYPREPAARKIYLRAMAEEAVRQQFDGDPEGFRNESFLRTKYSSNPYRGREMSAANFLEHYALQFMRPGASREKILGHLIWSLQERDSEIAADALPSNSAGWNHSRYSYAGFRRLAKPLILHTAKGFEDHPEPQSMEERAAFQKRREHFIFERRHAPPQFDLEQDFEVREIRVRADAIERSVRSVIRRLGEIAESVYTCSFPGQPFVSPSGRTRFESWNELLRAGARAEFQLEQRSAAIASKQGLSRKEAPPAHPISCGTYLRKVLQSLCSSKAFSVRSAKLEIRVAQDQSDYHLVSLENLDLSKAETEQLATVLSEIVQQQFAGNSAGLNEARIQNTRYSAPGSLAVVTGAELLEKYRGRAALLVNGELKGDSLIERVATSDETLEAKDGVELDPLRDYQPTHRDYKPTQEPIVIPWLGGATPMAIKTEEESAQFETQQRDFAVRYKLKPQVFPFHREILDQVIRSHELCDELANFVFEATNGTYGPITTCSFPGQLFTGPSGQERHSWIQLLHMGVTKSPWGLTTPSRMITEIERKLAQRSNVAYRPKYQSGYHLPSLGRYSDADSKEIRRKVLQEIFAEICDQVAGGIPERLSYATLAHEWFITPPGFEVPHFASIRQTSSREIRGQLLLDAYKRAALNKNASDGEVFKHLISYLTKFKAAVKEEIAKTELQTELRNSPALLFRALTVFGWEQESLPAFRAFQAKLKRSERSAASDSAPKTIRQDPVALYTQALSAAAEGGLQIDLDELGLQAHCDLLREMCLHCYNGDVEQLIQALSGHADRIPEQTDSQVKSRVRSILDRVCPAVQELFQAFKEFVPPSSLKRELFPHQIVAIVENLKQGKRINAHEMGNGKSLTALALCEHKGFERVMWVTSAANRTDVQDEILKSVEIDRSRVRIIPADAARGDSTKLEQFLDGAKYVICANETLRACYSRNKGVHKLLCEWTGSDGGLVVDEAHLFDNPDSQRSMALAGMVAEWRYLLSGSVYQARFSRIASLIHLLNPKQFPNFEELQRSCTDREFAQTLLGRYASIAFTDDVARRFDHPEVRPFRDQLLSGLPHVPRAVEQPIVRAEMPSERAAAYLEIACDFDGWSERQQHSKIAHDSRHRALRQLISMVRALYDPEKLGLAPSLELLAAAKEIALPLMERGEKVLFFGQHRSIVNLLANDAELRSFGLVKLDGTVAPEARAKIRVAIEEDPSTLCAVAQFDASATGSNFRGIAHVIYLECPNLFSTYWQSRGRAIRNLGPGDERFARTEVHFWHIVLSLPPELVRQIKNPELRGEIEEGTLSERWQAALVQKRADFLYLMRKRKEILEDGTDSALQYVKAIASASARSEFASDGSRLVGLLAPESGGAQIVDYGTPIKAEYRRRQYTFLDRHRRLIDPKIAEVMALVGPEGLELDVYDRLGYPRHHLHCVEGGTAAERKIFRQTMRGSGCRPYETKIERLMPCFPFELGVLSLDRDGYLVPGDIDTFRQARLAPFTAVIKNSLASREEFGGKELLEEVGEGASRSKRRELLERAAFKLLGTAYSHPLGHLSGVEAVRHYSLVRFVARRWSRDICAALNTARASDVVADYLADTYLGSPTILDEERFSYRSARGSPFMSMFAIVARPDEKDRNTPLAGFIRHGMAAAVRELYESGSRSGIDSFNFKTYSDRIVLCRGNEAVCSVALSEFQLLLHHSSVPEGRVLAYGS